MRGRGRPRATRASEGMATRSGYQEPPPPPPPPPPEDPPLKPLPPEDDGLEAMVPAAVVEKSFIEFTKSDESKARLETYQAVVSAAWSRPSKAFAQRSTAPNTTA